jgi:beta-lactamase class A
MTDESQWLDLQKRLGPQGRLGVAFKLFSPEGSLHDEITFNADDAFPMASIAKITVGMLACARIKEGTLTPSERISIEPKLLAPGFARSPIDHLFYVPFNTHRSETVARLMAFMIRRSDNSSTDALLNRIGGVAAVDRYLQQLGVRGIHLSRTFRELVSFYFGFYLPDSRPPHLGQIIGAVARLVHPFNSREKTEQSLIDSRQDCCTPRGMTDLLSIAATQEMFAPLYINMEQCVGGLGRIRKGLSGFRSMITSFGHKTGGMGGIANDAGIVKFKDGSFAAICIMTCRANTRMESRNEQIAAATKLAIGDLRAVLLDSGCRSR